ncbi:hypothetical protein GDO86_004374 [Hymenochirus boettgeri]|nr:hypothetical protein GDO86_004374 [Hymenochirus boettgeri]
MLFIYMVVLILVFIFQFIVSCSCLAMNRSQQEQFLNATWSRMSDDTRLNLETTLECCGFLNTTDAREQFKTDVARCSKKLNCSLYPQKCLSCGEKMLTHADEALKILGGVGLFFSFTEILGVWLAFRYRNQKDPRANPSAFL